MGIFEEVKEYLQESEYNCIEVDSGETFKEPHMAIFWRDESFVRAKVNTGGRMCKKMDDSETKDILGRYMWQKKELSDLNIKVPWDELEEMAE